MKEIKMRLPKSASHLTDVCGDGLRFCADTFFKVTQVPVGTRQCYLVLYETKPNVHADSIYSITRPLRNRHCFLKRGPSSRIREVDHQLHWCTEYALARLYKDGYKYFTVEYVEN